MQPKRLEILKDSVSGLRPVAVFTANLRGRCLAGLRVVAIRLDLTLIPIVVRSPADLESAVASVAKSGAQAIYWIGYTRWGAHHRQVVETLGKARLPAIYPQINYARRGGLMANASDMRDNFRVAVRYVDEILKGAKPAELPIEQPQKVEFVVNLAVAKAQGINLPDTILQRATEVIQ